MSVHVPKGPAIAAPTFVCAAIFAAVAPAGSARADDEMMAPKPELQGAVEYFVQRPIRLSRDQNRGRVAINDWSFNVSTSVEYGSSHPDPHLRGDYAWFNETSVAVYGLIDCPCGTGGTWAAELEISRAGDLREHLHPLDWAYEGSLHRNWEVGGQIVQSGFFIRYDDGASLGRGDDAGYAAGVSLAMPFTWADGMKTRGTHGRDELSNGEGEKFIPSVSIEETFDRSPAVSGQDTRDWDSQVALGWEHPISRRTSFGVTAAWNYLHVFEDSNYTARVSLTHRIDEMMSFELFVVLQRGFLSHLEHSEVVGGCFGFDF
jgi:hypothetical protein